MLIPIFALSKNPDFEVFSWNDLDSKVEVTPSSSGRATIWDKDILLFCMSKIVNDLNDGVVPSRVLSVKGSEILRFCSRGSGGQDYKNLSDALDRLRGTSIKTDIKSRDVEFSDDFTLLSRVSKMKIVGNEKSTRIRIELSEWIFTQMLDQHYVLTYDPGYFKMTSAIHRRLYEIFRKHCGEQPKFLIRLRKLFFKIGSKGSLNDFKKVLRKSADYYDEIKGFHSGMVGPYEYRYHESREIIEVRFRRCLRGE
ncbi:MAG: replication initiator protein A [Pseudomonadota bacterium]